MKIDPIELCKYIIRGDIFQDIPTDEADHAELGRYIWPERYDRLRKLAEEALGSEGINALRRGKRRPTPADSL